MQEKNPIILIPGIQGTKLCNINEKNFDTVWSGFRKFFDNIYDLTLDSDGKTDVEPEIVIERQDVEDLAYSEIVNYFRNRGYRVYIFGYDWRKSNLDSARELKQFVDIVRRKNASKSINFVTHSMGCLVFSGLLKQMEQHEFEVINKVIFTVPPFKGSVEALFNLIIGKSRLFNSSDDFRHIARTFPSIFELCPLYGESMKFKSSRDFDIYDFKNWQQNPNYSDSVKEQFEIRLKDLKKVRNQDNLIFDLSELNETIRKRMLVVAGVGDKTQRGIIVDDTNDRVENLFDFNEELEDDDGDGTVHIDSAQIFKEHVQTLSVKSRWIESRLDGRGILSNWHSFFLNNGRVQNILIRFLEKEKNDLASNWFESVSKEGIHEIT